LCWFFRPVALQFWFVRELRFGIWTGNAGFGKLDLISQAKKRWLAPIIWFTKPLAALNAEYQKTGSLSEKEVRQSKLGRSRSRCMPEDRTGENPDGELLNYEWLKFK
jgi:hypothetical protein